MEAQLPPLPKEQAQKLFDIVFADTENKKCFACGANSRQWASVPNAVFLCLSCASECRDLKDSIINIKSVNLDTWNEQQIRYLRLGGNVRLKAFLEKYKLGGMPFTEQVCTKACMYYRQKAAFKNQPIQPEPSYEEGRQVGLSIVDRARVQEQNKNRAANSQELLDVAKEKLVGAYEVTSKFTSDTYNKISDKLKNPQFRASVSEFGQNVKEKSKVVGRQIKQTSKKGYEKAKSGLSLAWNMLSTTFSDITKKD